MSEGSDLRAERDRAVEEAKAAKAALAATLAGSGAYEGVTAEHLQEFSPAEMAAKAKEIHDSNVAARESAVRQAFVAKGLSGDELENAVKDLLTPTEGSTPPPPPDADGLTPDERAAVERLRLLGGGGGQISDKPDTANMTPAQKAEAGIAANAAKRNARRGNP